MIANAFSNFGRLTPHSYQQLIQRLREEVSRAVPVKSTVLVVSKGDDALLMLGERRSEHLPQSEDGRYAGYYPANSEDAIAQGCIPILR